MMQWFQRNPSVAKTVAAHSFEMLPQRFRTQRKTRHTLYAWAALSLALAAVLFGSYAALWAAAKRAANNEDQLIHNAAPLFELREDIKRMQRAITRGETGCSLVESAKPDDSLLQSLAAVTLASQSEDDTVLVDSVQITLPLEFPQSHGQPPPWAEPSLRIDGSTGRDDAVGSWIERINASDRVAGAQVQQAGRKLLRQTIQVSAKPVSTGVLP